LQIYIKKGDRSPLYVYKTRTQAQHTFISITEHNLTQN